MKHKQFSFLVPVSENITRNKLNYSKNCGDVTVTVDPSNDNEITALTYEGNLLSLLHQIEQTGSTALDYFYNAVENYLQTQREEEAVREENEEREAYN